MAYRHIWVNYFQKKWLAISIPFQSFFKMAAIFFRFIIKYFFYIFKHLVGETFVKLGRNTYLDTFFIKYGYQLIEFYHGRHFLKNHPICSREVKIVLYVEQVHKLAWVLI